MAAEPSENSRALTVAEALARILDAVTPVSAETLAIGDAHGRVLASPLVARLTQPPFDASAMDGYALRAADIGSIPCTLRLVGESAAGHPFAGSVGAGEAVRIFTGAPIPTGADAVVIQENTAREGDSVRIVEGQAARDHIRPRGSDFAAGDELLAPGRLLGPRELSLAAAMGHGTVPVRRRPRVGVLATGDELVAPGETPGVGQIVASNHLGVADLARRAGADVVLLGIARDTRESLEAHIAKAADCDILVTIGGASVGDHDLVGPTLAARGLSLSFWKIAMRPGKPLMFGALGAQRVMGLPGNPVSALVCARVFLVPLVSALLGRPPKEEIARTARTTARIGANGPRTHYMRGITSTAADGTLAVTPVPSQDSSLLSPLARADVLIVHDANAGAVEAGGPVAVLALDM
jgi:molybdopterin molybdotransferase